MGIKLSNNAFATLAAGITSSATSITLTTGQGARFPSLSVGDYFYATLIDTSNNLEIVKCTARSTDVLTVTRAQESTTARAYSTGDRIEIRITAQTFIDAVAEIGPTQISDKANTSTGYMVMPVGTTAQRPGTPTTGMYRMNSTTGNPEWYDSGSSSWIPFNSGVPFSADYLVIAGGGSGATSGTRSGNMGGGGGAGGRLAGTFTLTKGNTYTVTVGAGGANTGPSTSDLTGNNGSNSVFSGIGITTLTAIGGGAGGIPSGTGFAGGSGGGGGSDTGYAGGAGTSGQGNAGGSGVVILSVPTSKYSGVYTGSPTITTSGSNTIIKFTASGTYTA